MDINEKLQQINTFVKGMNTDTSDMYLSSDQYRYAENVRIVTNKENNAGEVRLIEGTKLFVLDNEENTTNNCPFDFSDLEIIASDKIRNIGVIITRKNTEDDKSWSVYKFEIGTFYKTVDGNRVEINNNTHLIFGPCTELIWPDDWDGKGKVISTVMRYESRDNIKLYIADQTGKHPVMSLLISKNEFIGKDFNDVFSYQNIAIPSLEVNISESSGSIYSGKVLYVYRLYLKYGSSTTTSPLSKVLSLYKNTYSGYPKGLRSGRAVDIKHPNVSQGNLDRIEIYRIQYEESGQQPKIYLIKDEQLNLNYTTVDNGSLIKEISVSEFLSLIDSKIIPKILESKGDYLFASNLKYVTDSSDKLFENFDARSYSYGNIYTTDDGDVNIFEYENWDDIDLEKLSHLQFQQGQSKTYNNVYNKNYWMSVTDPSTELENDYAKNAAKGYNGYGKCFLWRYVYDNIDTPKANNQGALTNTKKTFRCEETYRFGVRLFDKNGNASSVKWIADIMIPAGDYIYMFDDTIKYRNVGIEFKINKSYVGWEENWKDVSGFEIVRCDRTVSDRSIITQGIAGKAFECLLNVYCAPGFFTENTILASAQGYAANTRAGGDPVYVFSSPEYCYQEDDIQNLLKSYNDKIIISRVATYDSQTKGYTWRDGIPYPGGSCVRSDNNASYPLIVRDYSEQGLAVFDIYLGFISNALIQADDFYYDIKDGARTWSYFNYVRPKYYFAQNPKTNIDRSCGIKHISFSKAPEYSDFASDNVIKFKNDTSTVGDNQFINWTAPLMICAGDSKITQYGSFADVVDPDEIFTLWENQTPALFPLGAGGKTILFIPEDTDLSFDINLYCNAKHTSIPQISVINIKKPATPYGGYNKTQINNSKYLSFGDFIEYNRYSTNSIKVFSGDTVIRAFTYNASKIWYDSWFKLFIKNAVVYCVPLECDIDIQAQYGVLYNTDGMTDYRVQDYACAFDTYVQEKDAYLYNTVYNASPDIITYYSDANNDYVFNNYDTRIHYSEPKTNNESIDSWLQFKTSNFIDVDTRHGEITGMKLFKDKLIFWLENATGIAAVNERIVLKDSSDNLVTLGVGGVLERTDYITTEYGLKKQQYAYDTSDSGLYWWDGNKKEIVLYNDGYKITPLSIVKTVQNYINNNYESFKPSIIYDPKYKEVLCNVVNNEALVYSEQIQQFSSIYKFNPTNRWNIYKELYISSDTITNGIYSYNVENNYASSLFDNDNINPLIKFIINSQPMYNKVYDIQTFGGRFYGGEKQNLQKISFKYNTPLKQESSTTGESITNLEYDFRLVIPRNDNSDYGDRMRGKTMQCEIKSNDNNLDFSLQYVITKFRMSWT